MPEHSAADSVATGERVLIIPGLDGKPRMLERFAPRLFPDMRALVFDHHLDEADDGVEGLAERALRVLDADRDGGISAFVCGESFGGTVALTIALRHPERVRGLILLSAFAWYPAIAGHARRLGMRIWRLVGDRVAARVFRLWRPFSMPAMLGPECPEELTAAFLDEEDVHLPSYRAKCGIALAFDARPWLEEIICPTFILTGTRDPAVPISAGRELARRIPNARLHCLPGGHLVHIVRAEEVAALIADWIRDECLVKFPDRPAAAG